MPHEKQLSGALEAMYRSKHFYSPIPEWMLARLDVPGHLRAALGGQSEEEPQEDDHVGSDADDSFEPHRHPEATLAVIRARLNSHALENFELEHGLFKDNIEEHLHLDLRNHIVRMWYRNPKERLSVTQALGDVPETFWELGARVYTFLNVTGIINFGVVPLESPYAHQFPVCAGNPRKRIAIVGAGISGLIAARQLVSFGFDVTVFEARDRPGGRIFTDTGRFSGPVDLGAMVLTGVVQNPISILAEQTDSETYVVKPQCPLFDVDGKWVSSEEDDWAEKEYNAVLSATARYREREASGRKVCTMSLGKAFQQTLIRRTTRRLEQAESIKKSLILSKLGSAGGNFCRDATPETEGQLKDSSKAVKYTFSGPLDGRTVDKNYENRKTESRTDETCMRRIKRHKSGPNAHSYGQALTGGGVGVKRAGQSDKAVVQVGASGNLPSEPGGMMEDERKNRENRENRENRKISLTNDGKRRMSSGLIGRLMRWHIANLEYGCAAPIDSVSLKYWDQDDPYGFIGDHALLKRGFGPLISALMEGLEDRVVFGTEVTDVCWNRDWENVRVDTRSTCGDRCSQQRTFGAVLVTAPLGVLKEGLIKFHPCLPKVKREAINRLGSGGLMKVALEFPARFWGDVDTFGALRDSAEKRGTFYLFWSLFGATGRPVLLSLVIEPRVSEMEGCGDDALISEAMGVLRKAFPEAPEPVATAVTRWSSDPYARGAYSNIPVGSSGEDYDRLADPVGPTLFFAGEHTCRQYPTTCASGIISGLREANRIVEKFGSVEDMTKVDRRQVRSCVTAGYVNSGDPILIDRRPDTCGAMAA